MKVATFTVHADVLQSARWKQATQAEGFQSVGAWLAGAADAYLKVRARAGVPIPLAWRRGTFNVELATGERITARGKVSLPFGIYEGTGSHISERRIHRFTLVYMPAGRPLATLESSRNCKALAAELARTWVRWDGQGGEPGERLESVVSRLR